MALTQKQRRFVDEYLIDLNGAAAARRAGYSEKTAHEQAARLLANVSIAAAVDEAMKARSERTKITADRVLQELAKIGFADIRHVMKWGETVAVPVDRGEGDETADDEDVRAHTPIALIPSDQLDSDTAAAVSEVRQTKEGLAIKMHDKLAALDKIARHLGMFKEKVELTGKDGAPLPAQAPILNVNFIKPNMTPQEAADVYTDLMK